MSFVVNFYNFYKRHNSTKQPSVIKTTCNCVLKDKCSLVNPVLVISPISTLSDVNYCHIPNFNRYYFISDIQYYRERIEVYCKVDTLATFKADILASTHYVLRSASASNGNIIDNLYPTKGDTQLLAAGATVEPPFHAGDTTSVIGVINNNSSYKFGAVQYYTVSDTAMGDLMYYLLGGGNGDIITDTDAFLTSLANLQNQDIINSISRSLLNPAQYITESFMIPYVPPTSGPATGIKCGWFNIPSANGKRVNNASVQFPIRSVNFALPDHPQSASRGNYLNLSPYSRYWLYLGCFGTYVLDSTYIYDSREVDIDITGDLMGNVTAKIYAKNAGGLTRLIDVLHANVKANFPVGQTTMDVSRAVGGVSQMGAGIAQMAVGDPSGIASGLSGIQSAVSALLPKMSSSGSQGTFVNVFDNWHAYSSCQLVVDEMNSEKGRPLCESRQLSTLSGYCLCSNADMQINGTITEMEILNNHFNSGFYIE